jgi:peptidoglycan hydrolase-like protein with peptidoglycan-binding domain
MFGVSGQPRSRVVVAVTAAIALLAGIGVYVLTSGGSTPPNTPAPGSSQADGSEPIRVTFSAPLAAGSPMPTVTPSVGGSWQRSGDAAVFTPNMPFSPLTRISVTVPAGMRSTAGHTLAAPTTAAYTTATYSTLRLAEMLGELGYLPMSWQLPDLGMRIASEFQASSAGLAGQETLAYDAPSGIFSWTQGYPAELASLWQPGNYNVITKGAVMAFQSEHGMTPNGDVDGTLWAALFQAASRSEGNANGYTYAVASKASPETLTIYHDGQVVLHSLANTGIPAAPTADGTFPVYQKFLNTIMSGTNPDGSHYSDPVKYVSYFNGGDAVHYFARGSYGFQQSLGCVELPLGAAQQAYPFLTLGSLVTVAG